MTRAISAKRKTTFSAEQRNVTLTALCVCESWYSRKGNDVPGDVLFHGKHTACVSNPGLLSVVYNISLYMILLFF
jgi:hypothetical protein